MRTTIQEIDLYGPSGLGRVAMVETVKRKPFTVTYSTADNQAVSVQAVYALGGLYVSLSGGPYILAGNGSTKDQAIQSLERSLAGSSYRYFTDCYNRYSNATKRLP